MDIAWGTDSNLDDSQFYNRTDDLEFIGNLLDTTQRGSAPTILLTGLRGVGKTALINKLKDEFKNDYLVISMDLSATDSFQYGKLTREGFVKKFYSEIIKSSKEANLVKALETIVKKFFKTHNIKLIDRFVDYNDVPIPVPGLEEDYTKLAEFVMDLPQNLYDNSKNLKGVFVFIDEFQYIKELDNLDSFLWNLRSKVQSQKNVSYLFSGSMSIKDSLIGKLAGRDGAFGGRMLEINIEPFSYETTKSYLEEKSDNLLFTEDGFKRFYDCTKGIPYYINTFAKLMSKNVVLDEKRVKIEFKKSIRYLAIHLINQWDRLTLQEQQIVIQLLDGPLKRIEIADNLEVTTGSLSKPLNHLIDEVLIELNEDRKYMISDSILAVWLKSEYDKKGIYPFRSI